MVLEFEYVEQNDLLMGDFFVLREISVFLTDKYDRISKKERDSKNHEKERGGFHDVTEEYL